MYLFRTPYLIFLSLLLLSNAVLGQGEVPAAPSEVPKQVEAFKKGKFKSSWVVKPKGKQLERLISLLPGIYSNDGESSLVPHVYEMVPIWKNRSDDVYWFYEGISNAFDTKTPFSQRIISIQKSATGILWQTYRSDSLKKHTEVYKDPEQLSYIQKENLKPVEGCDIIAKELKKNHFLLRHRSQQCNNLSKDKAGYTVFEYHFFPQGFASRPLAFDQENRLVWGDKSQYYLMQRHRTSQSQAVKAEKNRTP